MTRTTEIDSRHPLLLLVALLASCAASKMGDPNTGGGGQGGGVVGQDAAAPGEGGGTGAGGVGGGSACAPGLTACDGSCVDLASNQSHCGSCARACAATESCTASSCRALPADCRQTPCPGSFYCDLGSGACKSGCASDADCSAASNRVCTMATHQCDCKSDFHVCGGACVSNGAVTSCGARCDACPSDPQGAATCDGTSCGVNCNSGMILCGGACIPCADPHAASSCVNNACSLACQATYNLCGGRCTAPNDATACGPSCAVCTATGASVVAACEQGRCSATCAPGTTLCKGQCKSGTCTWNTHTATGTIAFMAVDVGADGIVHGATTTGFNPSYHRIAGAGAPATEIVNSMRQCWFNTSQETRPIVAADATSGKARILCAEGIDVDEFSWSGSAWVQRGFFFGSGGYSTVFGLSGNGDRVVFFYVDSGTVTTRFFNFAERLNGTWTVTGISKTSGTGEVGFMLGGSQGAAKVAWIPNSTSPVLSIAAQSASGFAVAQALPHAADVYTLDASGTVVGASKNLSFYNLNPLAPSAEPYASGSYATALDLVVDAAGVPRIAWINASGVRLATRLGTTWTTEMVSTTAAQDVDLAVGPNGKVAIGVRTSTSTLVVFD